MNHYSIKYHESYRCKYLQILAIFSLVDRYIYSSFVTIRMLKVNLEALEKMTNQGEQDEPDRRVTGNFALYSTAGTKSGSVVYFELESGCELGTHTDSAEEIVYIADGTVELSIGNEKNQVSRGELGVVPVMEPHNFRSIGSNTAKVIGFFPSSNVVSTFEKFFLPLKFKEFDTTKLPAPKMKS